MPDGAEGDGFQVQFLDTKLAAVDIQLRLGGELVGEATVLTFNDEVFLLATMTWHRVGGNEIDVGAQQRAVTEALLLEAADLAGQHEAALLTMVGRPTDDFLVERGFERVGPIWRREPGAVDGGLLSRLEGGAR